MATRANPAGYSGTPLPQKLGLKDGGTLVVVDAPPALVAAIVPLPAAARIGTKLSKGALLVLLACPTRAALDQRLVEVATKLHPDGALWIAWPKKTSKQFVDLTEDSIREVALPMGLVDVKVCAVDADWSGLKLMVRKDRRAGWP